MGEMLRFWASRSRFEKVFAVLFLLTIPFVHPSVFSDGAGYYAYLRSPLIDHNFRFASDWNDPPNTLLRDCTVCPSSAKTYWNHPANRLLFVDLNGRIHFNAITKTGHLPNFYSVGPAILWFPFVGAAHLAVLTANHLGWWIQPDGHSWPYVFALSAGTTFYGFLGLYLSFQLAKSFVAERWAFWATMGVWLASSLPMSLYLEPSWSHTHSAFCVALFLWYWYRTRCNRNWKQWAALGLISGLMVDVYLANAVFLLAPAVDCAAAYVQAWRNRQSDPGGLWKNLQLHLTFAACVAIAFLPTLISREIVFGSPFAVGMYGNVSWNWKSPAFGAVLFSGKTGLFVCTPILLLAVLGLVALCHLDWKVGGTCLLMILAFYYLISVYPWWNGMVSFGNRFFISLTPIFVVGLAAALSWSAHFWGSPRIAARRIVPVMALLVLWNLGLLYQWSNFLFFPEGVGEVSWSEVLYNQFRVVPQQIASSLVARIGPHL